MGKKTVIVVSPDPAYHELLSPILKKAHYHPSFIQSLTDVRAALEKQRGQVLLLDLDRTLIDKLFVKELRRDYPLLSLIGLSSRTFHQELVEVMSQYIDACFDKSLQYEDLLYWLKAVFEPSLTRKTLKNEAGE